MIYYKSQTNSHSLLRYLKPKVPGVMKEPTCIKATSSVYAFRDAFTFPLRRMLLLFAFANICPSLPFCFIICMHLCHCLVCIKSMFCYEWKVMRGQIQLTWKQEAGSQNLKQCHEYKYLYPLSRHLTEFSVLETLSWCVLRL